MSRSIFHAKFQAEFGGLFPLGRYLPAGCLLAASLLPAAPAQAAPPAAGSRPAVAVSEFVLPAKADASSFRIERALAGAGLSVGGAGTSERYGQNAHVTVVVACAQLWSGQTQVAVVAASTAPATADFYRADLTARTQAKDPRLTPPGETAPPPAAGNAPGVQFGSFEPFQSGLSLAAADNALAAEGLSITGREAQYHIAVNDHAAVVVTWAVVCPQSHPPAGSGSDRHSGEIDRFVVISLSTNSVTAAYYRSRVQESLDSPVLSVSR